MRSAAALLGLFVMGSLAFTACDGDDDTVGGTGGTGGAAGKGSGGTSGSKAEAGESGAPTSSGGTAGSSSSTGGSSSGKGGKGGKGGNGTGGNGTSGNGTGGTTGGTGGGAGENTSGSAGDDGAGGTTGGTGGVLSTGGTSGASGDAGAGAGGDAGSGGEAGGGSTLPATPKTCSYQCSIDDDCDPDHDITCVEGLCLDAARVCNVTDDCIPFFTDLVESCTQDADCDFFVDYGDLCMNVAGAGYCVMVPFEDDCAFGKPTVKPKFGSIDTAEVCLDTAGRCDARQCFKGCTSEEDFCTTSPNDERGPVCNEDTGRCGGCESDGDCGGAGTSHCNVATGVCGCQADGECTGIAGMATCVAGKCSCSGTSCTTSTFPGATALCQ